MCGAVLVLLGVGGVIDRITGTPLLGPAIAALHRQVLPHVHLLAGHQLFTHLMVGVTGVVLIIAAERWEA